MSDLSQKVASVTKKAKQLPQDESSAVSRACCKPPWLHRVPRFVSWIVPGAVLALMPKCPVCLAAYIALGTGVALSLPAAENLRLGALVLSSVLLGALMIRVAVRFRPMTDPTRRRISR